MEKIITVGIILLANVVLLCSACGSHSNSAKDQLQHACDTRAKDDVAYICLPGMIDRLTEKQAAQFMQVINAGKAGA